MDSTVTSSSTSPFRHRRSPSADRGRFLGIFSEPSVTAAGGVELEEDDVFWSDDISSSGDLQRRSENPRRPPASPRPNGSPAKFHRQQNFGILAALPDTAVHRGDRGPFLHRPIASSPSSSRMIPSIPKLQAPAPSGKFHQSAPVNVPVLPVVVSMNKMRNSGALEECFEDEDADDERLPPHEIVARGSARSLMTSFSVLEGKGRTLKGRDLRRVRNAVFQRTGFMLKD